MAERQVTSRPRRGERRLITRAQLLDAAERVFARHGYQGASIDAIAAEAGYSHGAIYANFDGKEDLFLVLVEERIDALIEDKKRLSALVVGTDEAWLTELDNDTFKDLIALVNGLTIERLADPQAAPDELFAHAIAAVVDGFSRPPA